jgi:hypothetical protein
MRINLKFIMTAMLILVSAIAAPGTHGVVNGQNPSQPAAAPLLDAYDPAHINGLVFITGNQGKANIFGIRILVYRQGEQIDDSPVSFNFGPHSPNGSYAAVNWVTRLDEKTPVNFRWSRSSQNGVIGQVTASSNVRIAIEVYRPWIDTSGVQQQAIFHPQPDRRTILGEQVQNRMTSPASNRFLFKSDRDSAGSAGYEDATAMREMLVKDGQAQQITTADGSGLFLHALLSFDLSTNSTIGFVALVGDSFDEMEREAIKSLQQPVNDQLDRAEKNYQTTRTAGSGASGDGFEALNRIVCWNRFYDPVNRSEYLSPHRTPGRSLNSVDKMSGSTVLGWESFLFAAMAAMVDPETSLSTARRILEGQMSDGRLSLQRSRGSRPLGEPEVLAGRSMPPIGALSVWKIYLVTGDVSLLANAFPRLLKWNDWWLANRGDGQAWRDGNSDGLLELGYDQELELGSLMARSVPAPVQLKRAFSESGLDDRPQWTSENGVRLNEKTHTAEFTPVGLNALYALDTEMLMQIARELGLTEDAEKLRARYSSLKTKINTDLWSEEDGLYLNKDWDGKFSHRISPENFYPLIAGLPDEGRAKRMLETLRRADKLWGETIIPTISRDDAAFSAQTVGRGAIWSLMNYLLYQGLRRYAFNDQAGELAAKSNLLFRTQWEKTGRAYDHFSSDDGKPVDPEPASMHQSIPGLMLWPAIEEIIYADPWAGFSVGSVNAANESRLDRIRFGGIVNDIISGPRRTVIRRSGKTEVECEGPVRLRSFRSTEAVTAFAIESGTQVRVLIPAIAGRKITVSVDDIIIGSTAPGAPASFKVPAGQHRVFIVK